MGLHKINEVVEAIISPDGGMAISYDSSGSYFFYYKPAWELVSEESTRSSLSSLRDFLGQDLSRIEFK